jgi:hypothetical protein
MQISALRRCGCLVDEGEKAYQSGTTGGKQVKVHGVVFCSSSGAVGWIIPVPDDTHTKLANICAALHTSLEHVAGLNPHTFRAMTRELTHMYGAPAPVDGILDFDLLHQFCMLPRSQQKEVAQQHGFSEKYAVKILCQLQASSAAFF